MAASIAVASMSGCQITDSVAPKGGDANPRVTFDGQTASQLGREEIATLQAIIQEVGPHLHETTEGGWSVDPHAMLSPFAEALARELGVVSNLQARASRFAGVVHDRSQLSAASFAIPSWFWNLAFKFVTKKSIKQWMEAHGYICFKYAPWWLCALPAS